MPDARHTRLVSLGIDPVGGDRGDTVVLPPALDSVATRRLIEILNAGRGAGSVLIVCPAWADALTLRRLRLARAATEHGRVGVVLTSLPPLGIRVLLSQAHEVLTDGVAGWAHTVLGALERQYLAFAALPSIRGLHHPAPSFGQHLASMAPRTGFVAMTHPAPEVRRIRSGEPVDLPLPPDPAVPVFADASGGAERLRAGVLAGLPGEPEQVDPDGLGPRFWGTDRYTEAVVHPRLTAGRRAQLRSAVRLRECSWCGGWVATSPCLFCAMVLDGGQVA
jgi:hypothetical protein